MAINRKAPRAGFIPYYIHDGSLYVMLMQPSNPKFGGSEFQMAKGRVEEGETHMEAAIREATEELGLRECNIVSTQFLGLYFNYTEVYYGEIKDKDDFGDFHFETGATKWMHIDEFFVTGRGLHRPIFGDMKLKLRDMGIIV